MRGPSLPARPAPADAPPASPSNATSAGGEKGLAQEVAPGPIELRLEPRRQRVPAGHDHHEIGPSRPELGHEDLGPVVLGHRDVDQHEPDRLAVGLEEPTRLGGGRGRQRRDPAALDQPDHQPQQLLLVVHHEDGPGIGHVGDLGAAAIPRVAWTREARRMSQVQD